MKILFVCRANVGRSQIAKGLFQHITGKSCESAGTKVEFEGQKIKEREFAKPVIDLMIGEGIDISEFTTNSITEEMIDKFDKIIVMAEENTLPDFLKKKSNKITFWDLRDPKGLDKVKIKEVINEIKSKINKIVKY